MWPQTKASSIIQSKPLNSRISATFPEWRGLHLPRTCTYSAFHITIYMHIDFKMHHNFFLCEMSFHWSKFSLLHSICSNTPLTTKVNLCNLFPWCHIFHQSLLLTQDWLINIDPWFLPPFGLVINICNGWVIYDP